MFENIHQVPPGCIAIAKNGGVRIQQYWETVYPSAVELSQDPRSEGEITTGFRTVLEDAVAERLTADVEVACYLSGGLDSSAVLGLAQKKLGRPIRAFTIAFEGAYDESPLAERTAAFTGSNYVAVPVGQRDLADNLSDAIWHSEKPIFNANTVAKFLLSRAVRDAGIKVVFTGEGSDEMLAGYPMDRRDNMLFGGGYGSEADRQTAIAHMLEANPLSRSLMFPTGTQANGVELIRAAIGFCPTWIGNMSVMFLKQANLLRPDAPGACDLDAPYRALLAELDIPERIAGRDPVNVSLYLWQKTMLVNFILSVLGDRMEMSHSIEGRVPFLDHHVGEYAAGLPMRFKIRGQKEKYILREATRDVITDELYQRQKHPFMAPPSAKGDKGAGADPLRALCEDIVHSPQFADQPFFDPVRTRAWVDSLADADAVAVDQSSPDLLRIASFSLMQQRFGIAA
jgi:asparagine synthase (glutamine-hydrolysing)